jgi:glucokinase
MKEVLALDIGGTNARIASIVIKDNKPIIRKQKVQFTKDVVSLAAYIKAFGHNSNDMCIGFAGPIMGNRAKLTNGTMNIDVSTLKKETKIENIRLINDFQANGYGLKYLTREDLLVINNGKGVPNNEVEMVVGPGTGLGKAYFMDGKVYPCEGGLTCVGIEDIDDYALVDYIRKKVDGQIYYEDLVSGRGLIDIYDYLEIKNNMELNMGLRRQIKEEPIHKAMLLVRHSSKDKLCDMTLRIFVEFYARFVRDSALNLISSKVYLVGGISEAIAPYLKKHFQKEFLNHRMYSGILKQIHVSVVLRQDLGLIGAGAVAGGLV